MMTTTSVVLLFGSDVDAGHVSTLASERSRLQSIIEETPGAVEVDLVSFGLDRTFPGIRTHVNLKGRSLGPLDAVLRAMGVFALRRKCATFPLGRLLNSMGPVDPGRVFWRAVRRDQTALDVIRRARRGPPRREDRLDRAPQKPRRAGLLRSPLCCVRRIVLSASRFLADPR